jgi:hypothetical protein
VDSLPPYIFDLATFDDVPAEIFRVIGFVPHWEHTEDDDAALFGIAVKRNRQRSEWPVPPGVALQKLAANPGLDQRFRETFPFISYS